MAYTTINKSTDYFNTVLYTGDGNDGRAVTGVGFQPDFCWFKSRSAAGNYHDVYDAIRGATKRIYPNDTSAEQTVSAGLQSFTSDGFTLGNNSDVNQNSVTYASWNWKAGTAVSGNTTGSGSYKSYTGSVNTTSGFSIIKYTGNGTSGHTIPHHLGSVPAMVIFKQLNATRGWGVYHQSRGAGKIIYLDENIAEQSANILTGTPTSSVISLPALNENNINDASYVAYCFAAKTGYSKFGSYTGNGNADGTFVYTGFKPAFVIVKRTDASANWLLYDNKREGYNQVNDYLNPDNTNAEGGGDNYPDLLSNGFKPRVGSQSINVSGATYLYMAFGQSIVGTNNIPATAR